ncbi:MAG: cytochrome c maturation protein CcmE [Actinobacteria bacterium]|nr:cytochrome c maturation protein CcmE [Actinomycetota bacterium]
MDVTHFDDPESADASDAGGTAASAQRTELNLEPRTAAAPRKGTGAKAWGMWALLAAIVIAIVVVGSSLIGASTYFYNVDEAVERRAEIGDKRIRLQGNVTEGSVVEGDRLRFVLSFHDVEVDVEHTGEVPDLFGTSIPLVIEGRFEGDDFHSDRVFVKHDATYEEEHDDRISDAEKDAQKSSASPAGAADEAGS